jgi:hypothetical protein
MPVVWCSIRLFTRTLQRQLVRRRFAMGHTQRAFHGVTLALLLALLVGALSP